MGYSEFSARQLQADLGAPIANRELERGISFVRDVATRGAWDSPSGRRSAGNGGELQTAVAASRDSCPGRRVPVQGHGLRDGPLWPLSRLAALAGAGRARGFGWTNYVHSCSKPASPRAPALTGKRGEQACQSLLEGVGSGLNTFLEDVRSEEEQHGRMKALLVTTDQSDPDGLQGDRECICACVFSFATREARVPLPSGRHQQPQ